MTPVQKKQVTDALVAFVLTVTDSSNIIDRSEAMALSAALDFLIETDAPERLYSIASGDEIISSTASPNLHKLAKKFAKSKE